MTLPRTAQRSASPAPYMGVDFRIPITQMPPEYSPFMVNFFAQNGRILLRSGHESGPSVSGVSPTVTIPYERSGSVENIVFNATETRTDAGTVATPSDLNSHNYYDWTIWQDRILVAGETSVWELDSSIPSWTSRLSFTPSASTTDHRRGICSYRQRIYVAEGTKLHYSSSPGAFSGSASTFDLTFLISGEAIGVEEFGYSAGFGLEQLLVIVTNIGEILVFSGSFPGASDWTLVQKIETAAPSAFKFFSHEIIKIPNDLLINAKRSYHVYSLRELLQNGGVATTYGAIEPIKPLFETITPSIAAGAQYIGNNSLAYWPYKNSLCLLTQIQAGSAGILEEWLDYISLSNDNSTPTLPFVEGFVAFLIDLNSGVNTMHTFHTHDMEAFLSAQGQLRSSSTLLLMPGGQGNSTILFGGTSVPSSADYYQDFGVFNLEGICTFAPLPAGRLKSGKEFVIYADLYDQHSNQFQYMINRDFDTSPGTFEDFNTSYTDRKIRAHVLPSGDVGNSIVYTIKQGGENPIPFEVLGTDHIFESGGDY